MSALSPPQPLSTAAPATGTTAPARMSAPLPSPFHGEERLNLSRERMRLYLETARGGKRSERLIDRANRSGWMAALRAHPAAGAVIGLVSNWWSHHPLRAVVALADGALRSSVGSASRQRPLAVVGLGVLAGVLAVWARPWRWLFRPAVFVGLMTQMLKRAIADMPLESMMKLFAAVAGGARNGAETTSSTSNAGTARPEAP